jgi:hypothetical protein
VEEIGFQQGAVPADGKEAAIATQITLKHLFALCHNFFSWIKIKKIMCHAKNTMDQ